MDWIYFYYICSCSSYTTILIWTVLLLPLSSQKPTGQQEIWLFPFPSYTKTGSEIQLLHARAQEKPRLLHKITYYKFSVMQHVYAYTQKPSGNKASYRTLFSFFAKLLLIITLAFLVMMINISKSSAQKQLKPVFNNPDIPTVINSIP